MASVREVGPGRFELRLYLGKDKVTGKPITPQKTIDAPDKRTAELEAAAWELQKRRQLGSGTGKAGDFQQLLIEFVEVRGRRWSPKTRRENLGIIDRYLGGLDPDKNNGHPLAHTDVPLIRTHTLDVFYTGLEAHGGECQHRPCPPRPCPGHPKPWCNRKGCHRRPCPGHPGERCSAEDCVRLPCAEHRGRCARWVPCEDSPCKHGAPLSPATVRRIHVVINAALEQAVAWEWGGVERNVAEKCNLTEIEEEETATPDIHEFVAILAATQAVDEDLADFELVAATTGARRGAVHAWRRSDLDLATGEYDFPRVVVDGDNGIEIIKARRKKRSGKGILDPYTLEVLRARDRRLVERALACGIILSPDALWFSDDPAGQVPWRPDSTSRKYRAIARSIGMGNYKLKALRNLMATVLLNASIGPKTVAQRGGWIQVATMLDRYARTTDPAAIAAAQKMGEIIERAIGG